ncbi:MAG: DUF2914 domain-containing protein, partial [Flavobacteriales bacterium]|nr:DUF2914 domain-containing protein [Flavobacteriales bacterium]
LYFDSERDGGIGGTDIYRAELQDDGSWANVTNLGRTVNTPYNDEAAFIHADNKTLYFSSDGHRTMGGFDIFKSTLDDKGIWSSPKNVGYPINSSANDKYLVVSDDGERGYYHQNRKTGYGDLDIYRIDFNLPALPEEEMVVVVKPELKKSESKESASAPSGAISEESKQAMRTELREEVMEEVREEVRNKTSEELRRETKPETASTDMTEVKEEQTARAKVKPEMSREDLQNLRAEVRRNLREEVRNEVREELRKEVMEEVRTEVRQELMLAEAAAAKSKETIVATPVNKANVEEEPTSTVKVVSKPPPPISISGSLVSSEGSATAVSKAKVKLLGDGRRTIAETTMDNRGKFSFKNLGGNTNYEIEMVMDPPKMASSTKKTAVERTSPKEPTTRVLRPHESSSDIKIANSSVCKNVEDRVPIGKSTDFPSDVEKIWFFTEVNLAFEVEETVTHKWYYKGEVVSNVELMVKGPRWRTFSYKTVKNWMKGDWKVEAISPNGVVIADSKFKVN